MNGTKHPEYRKFTTEFMLSKCRTLQSHESSLSQEALNIYLRTLIRERKFSWYRRVGSGVLARLAMVQVWRIISQGSVRCIALHTTWFLQNPRFSHRLPQLFQSKRNLNIMIISPQGPQSTAWAPVKEVVAAPADTNGITLLEEIWHLCSTTW